MVATWWMICSLKSCRKDAGVKGLSPAPLFPISREVKGKDLYPTASPGPWTYLSLDIRSNAEEQGPVEGEFNHVVPILRRDDALGEEGGVRDPTATSSRAHLQT